MTLRALGVCAGIVGIAGFIGCVLAYIWTNDVNRLLQSACAGLATGGFALAFDLEEETQIGRVWGVLLGVCSAATVQHYLGLSGERSLALLQEQVALGTYRSPVGDMSLFYYFARTTGLSLFAVIGLAGICVRNIASMIISKVG